MNRYIAQTRLEEVGLEGQKKLAAGKILIVGCGALGSSVAMQLAGAGVGTLILADFDTIEISNLHRQFFFQENEAGKSKALTLAQRITDLNSQVNAIPLTKLVNENLLEGMESLPDIIVDAADNPSTTYILEKFCVAKGIPLSTAGISGWKGQIFTWQPGCALFSDIFPYPTSDSGVLPCSIAGIIGPLAGMVASIQATEVIKLLLGVGSCSCNKLLTVDLLANQFDTLEI